MRSWRELLNKQVRLREGLEALRKRYGAGYLFSDPLEFPRRFSRKEDREVVGLVASSLAYGNVTTIRGSLERVLRWMGPRPADFARRLHLRQALADLSDFRYRWSRGRDVVCLVYFAGQMLTEAGSIEGFFRRGYDPDEDGLAGSLARFSKNVLALDHDALYSASRGDELPARAGVRFFFPSPRSGGACKRLNMFLRWMVRPDEGVDLGLWSTIPAADLVIPLDTHMTRIGQHLGWTRRRSPGWKMALDITCSLARIAPDDPVKYDFALSRMGILDGCPRHREKARCELCELRVAGPRNRNQRRRS
ncbi:MAG: TIGR02757 family protein [Acidobacteriota bacterium]